MMMIFAIGTTLALAGMAMLGAVLFRLMRSHRDLVERGELLKQRVMQVEQELGVLCSASLGAGDHLVKLEHRVQRMTERLAALELRAAGERPYAQATQLVTRGADIEELVDRCGLTRGEAELLVMMQRGAA